VNLRVSRRRTRRFQSSRLALACVGALFLAAISGASSRAGSSSSTTIFGFTSNASGWVGAPTSGSWVAVLDGTAGNPAGALKASVSGSGKTGSAISWTWSGSWTSLGVPGGTAVTAVTLTGLDSRVTSFVGGTASSFGTMQLLNGSGVSQGNLWGGRSFSAADGGWVAVGSQPTLTVPAAPASAMRRALEPLADLVARIARSGDAAGVDERARRKGRQDPLTAVSSSTRSPRRRAARSAP
jgi:hypothetical protein